MSTEHPPTDGDQPVESDRLAAQDDRPTAESASSPAAAESREWRPVAPSGGAPRRPLPPAVKYGGLGLLALLLVAAVLIGIALGVSAVIGFAAWPLTGPLLAAVAALGGAR